MKRKTSKVKFLLLIPAFLIGIGSYAQQRAPEKKAPAKKQTTSQYVEQAQKQTPSQTVKIAPTVTANKKSVYNNQPATSKERKAVVKRSGEKRGVLSNPEKLTDKTIGTKATLQKNNSQAHDGLTPNQREQIRAGEKAEYR